MTSEPQGLVRLPGSDRAPLAGVTPGGLADPAERAEVTLVLRRQAELPALPAAGQAFLTREELAERYGAGQADAGLVQRSLSGRGLEITAMDLATRRVKAAGTLANLSSAFGVTLQQATSPDPAGQGAVTHRYREGPLFVPAELDGVVAAVLGLDTRPAAGPQVRPMPAAAKGVSYIPSQVAGVYGFPAATTGAGQTIAVIELGGGFSASDLEAYFASLSVPVPSVTAVSVDSAANDPGSSPGGADLEVNLDIDVIGVVAPGAAQLVYFAPNTDQGFLDAISDAAHATPAPVAISISWGQSEDSWTAQARTAMDQAMTDAAALGITVCVAAGDQGSSDGVSKGQPHVDFPASSPHALACGGTSLHADPATG